jgi:hypothetical protein
MLAVVSSLALAGAAAASDATFDLRLDQKDGERTISVANERTGAFAVAAGHEELDLLEGDGAEAAFKRLKASPDIDIDLRGADDGKEFDGSGKRKIVIHKMDYDEDETGDAERREVRIVKRHQRDADAEDEIDNEDEIEIDLPGDDASTTERRVILINAADAKSAVKFIDRIKGLDDAERAAMKESVGL